MGENKNRCCLIHCQCGKVFSKQRRCVEQGFTSGHAGNRRSAVGTKGSQLPAVGKGGNRHSPGGIKGACKSRPVGEQPASGFIEFAAREIDKNKDFAVEAHQISLPSLCPSQMAISTLRGETQSPIRYNSGTVPFRLMYRSSSTCCPMTRTRES